MPNGKIAEIIYEGDWEIRGRLDGCTRDITDHFLINEDEVVKAIREAVLEEKRDA